MFVGMSGMVVGHIPFSEMKAFCDFHDVDDPLFFVEAVRELDNVYVKTVNEKVSRSSKKTSSPKR